MQQLSPAQKKSFEQAASQYQSDLAADTNAQAYLARRGIDQQTALSFRLGVVNRPIVGHEDRRGRLAIPYLTRSGVVNFSFRCLKPHLCKQEGCPKYLPITGLDRSLFNVGAIHSDADFICVCEGELDAITLTMCGIAAVGVPGVEHWKKHWPRCLDDFPEIFVIGDGDKAGKGFASFLAREIRARPLSLPEGEDPSSIFARHGAPAIHALFEGQK